MTQRKPTVAEDGTSGGRMAETAADGGPSAARRVLLVDDNHDTADMMQLCLEHRGHVVASAFDAHSALLAVETFSPEIVLLDIGLPDVDGYELAARLRQHPNARKAQLFAITGWGQREDVARSHASGFAYHLVKPVDIKALLDLIVAVPRFEDQPEPQ